MLEISKPLSFTFHRAFDCVKNPREALQELINLKVDRILTSGLEENAEEGIKLLKELKQIAKNKIIILPGSGINLNNVHKFKDGGFEEIHTSASKEILNNTIFFDNTKQTVSSIKKIQKILKAIQNA